MEDKREVDIESKVDILSYDFSFLNDGPAFFNVTIRNLSEKTIKAIRLGIKSYDSFNEEVAQYFEAVVPELQTGPKATERSTESIRLPNKYISKLKLIVTQIRFMDGSVENVDAHKFVREGAVPIEPDSLQAIREVVPNALYYPVQAEEYWICTCGYPNKKGTDECMNCNMSFADNFQLLVAEEVSLLVEEHRKKQEKLKTAIEDIERIHKKRKKKCYIIAASAVIISVSLYYLARFVIIPSGYYNKAIDYMEEENYAEAVRHFSMAGTYKDSVAKYHMAENKLEEQQQESDYEMAISYFESGEFVKAYDLLSGLADNVYRDSESYADKAAEVIYNKANTEMESGNLQYAYLNFNYILPYKDSYAKSGDCVAKMADRNNINYNRIIAVGPGFFINDNGYIEVNPDSPVAEQVNQVFSKYPGIVSINSCAYDSFAALKEDGTCMKVNTRLLNSFDESNIKDNYQNWTDLKSVTNGEYIYGVKTDGSVVTESPNKYIRQWRDIVSITANGKYVFGLKSNGTVEYAGESNEITRKLNPEDGWYDIVYIDGAISTNDECYAIRADGKIVSNNEKVNELIKKSENIKKIVRNEYSKFYGLSNEGTIIGNNTYSIKEIAERTDIQEIAATSNTLFAKLGDGTFYSSK